jgi:aspartyl-tRNA(Asn)/glutamyl-tRNA(Gln) amidotransferase subunit B
MEVEGELTATQAKKVLAELLERGGDPAAIARELGFEAMDQGALAAVVDDLIAAHPDEFERLKGGDQKVMGFFVGQAMKETQGKADGKVVTALLRDRASG